MYTSRMSDDVLCVLVRIVPAGIFNPTFSDLNVRQFRYLSAAVWSSRHVKISKYFPVSLMLDSVLATSAIRTGGCSRPRDHTSSTANPIEGRRAAQVHERLRRNGVLCDGQHLRRATVPLRTDIKNTVSSRQISVWKQVPRNPKCGAAPRVWNNEEKRVKKVLVAFTKKEPFHRPSASVRSSRDSSSLLSGLIWTSFYVFFSPVHLLLQLIQPPSDPIHSSHRNTNSISSRSGTLPAVCPLTVTHPGSPLHRALRGSSRTSDGRRRLLR